jgi:hypothetical protein
MGTSRAEPAQGIKTLGGLVVDFRERLGPEGPLEHGYMEWLRDSASWREAVYRAVYSRMPNGKMHNHQSRVPTATLLAYGKMIRKSRARYSDSFADLLRYCHATAIKGIGPVTVYDVATRLAAYLQLEPEHVYLHAGVREGAEALGVNTRGRDWIDVAELPKPLRVLSPDEAEDFICVYRSLFDNVTKGG